MVNPNTLPDLPTYHWVFGAMQNDSWQGGVAALPTDDMELGYLLLNRIVSFFTSDFSVFLAIYAFLWILLYFRTIKKNSPYVILSVLLLLLGHYNQSLFVLRQHLAIAIYVASIPLIINRKLIPFLLTAIVTFYIHKSSLIFIPVYFIYGVKSRRLSVWLIFVMAAAIFLSDYLLQFSAEEMNYEHYLERQSGANITTFAISVAYLVLYRICLKKARFDVGLNKLLYIILLISAVVNGICVGFNMGRVGMYFTAFSIFSVPVALQYIRNVHWRRLVGIGIIGMLTMQMLMGNSRQYYEYMQLYTWF